MNFGKNSETLEASNTTNLFEDYKASILAICKKYDIYIIKCNICNVDNCIEHCDFCNSTKLCQHGKFPISFKKIDKYNLLYFNFIGTETKNIYFSGNLIIRLCSKSSSYNNSSKNYGSIQVINTKNFEDFINTLFENLKNCQIILNKSTTTISTLITTKNIVFENFNILTDTVEDIIFDVKKSSIIDSSIFKNYIVDDEEKIKKYIDSFNTNSIKNIEGSLNPEKLRIVMDGDVLNIKIFFSANMNILNKPKFVLNTNNPLSNIYNSMYNNDNDNTTDVNYELNDNLETLDNLHIESNF